MREVLMRIKEDIKVLTESKKRLANELSTRDKMLLDITHFLELEDLGLIQMRKLAQKQRKVLKERRYYKTELQKLEAAAGLFQSGDFITKYDKHFVAATLKKYTPRKITLEEALS